VFLLCRRVADGAGAGAMALPLAIAAGLDGGGGEDLFRVCRARDAFSGSFFRVFFPFDEALLLGREGMDGRASDDE
jgi:hypothetical protein